MKKKTIGIILIFMLVIMLGIGITYAYFSAIIIGKENASTLVLEAGELEIDVDGGNIITASKFLPDSNVPFATKTITLTGKNTSIYLNMPYTIKLVVDNNTFTAGSIKYSISGVNNSSSGKVIPDMEMKDAGSTIIIGSGYFERGNPLTHTYTLKVYFPETGTDQSENMKAVYSAHIEVTGEEAEEPAPKGWWKAESGTLLAAIRDNSTLHVDETGMTVPGQDIATTDEQLRMTTDDYGVSFYYRGAVENNYVVFANKCWRIVRVTGNGSIKLVLYNDNQNSLSDNEVCIEKGGNLSFASTSAAYIENWKKNAYIGFMYGTPNSASYAEEHENKNESTILKKIKLWYDETFDVNHQSNLSDVIWCNDKSLANTQLAGKTGYSNLGYGTQKTFYGGAERLVSVDSFDASVNAMPTLVCPPDENGGKLSKFTANDIVYGNGKLDGYKVGLLTADEIAFAGGKVHEQNDKFYLNVNANGIWQYTNTPYVVDDENSLMFIQNAAGAIVTFTTYSTGALRPSIALNYDVTIQDKNALGTMNNPYQVVVPQS